MFTKAVDDDDEQRINLLYMAYISIEIHVIGLLKKHLLQLNKLLLRGNLNQFLGERDAS